MLFLLPPPRTVQEYNDFARRTNPYGLLLKRRGASVPGTLAVQKKAAEKSHEAEGHTAIGESIRLSSEVRKGSKIVWHCLRASLAAVCVSDTKHV